MNNEELQPEDRPLRALLRESMPGEPLPPRFRQNVWSRIEQSSRERFSILRWLEDWLGARIRPGLALGVVAAVMIIGGSLGVADGRSHSKQLAEQRYVASVSPQVEP